MRLFCSAAALLCLTLPIALTAQEAPVALIALHGETAQIESGGQTYLCGLARSEIAVTLADCLPLLTEAQTDRLAAAEAEVARLTEALAASQAETRAALAATEAAVAAAWAEAGAAHDATLEAMGAQIAQLEAQLAPFLAQNAAAQAEKDLRAKAAALSRAGGDLTRLIDAEVAQLGVIGYQAIGAHFGDRCTLRQADLRAMKEDDLQKIALPAVLAEMQVDPEIAALLLSVYFDPMNAEGSLHRAFVEAGDAVQNSEVYELVRTARVTARDNVRAFNKRVDEILQGSDQYVTLSADRTEIRFVGCE